MPRLLFIPPTAHPAGPRVQEVVAGGDRVYTFEPGGNAAVSGTYVEQQDVAGVTTRLQNALGLLASAAAPSVANIGTAGVTSYSYQVVAVNANGDAVPSAAGTTTTGNAVLSGANLNRLTWAAVPFATGYKVIRSASGGTPATTGLIATVGAGVLTLDDTGLAASAYTPAGANPGLSTVITAPE